MGKSYRFNKDDSEYNDIGSDLERYKNLRKNKKNSKDKRRRDKDLNNFDKDLNRR